MDNEQNAGPAVASTGLLEIDVRAGNYLMVITVGYNTFSLTRAEAMELIRKMQEKVEGMAVDVVQKIAENNPCAAGENVG